MGALGVRSSISISGIADQALVIDAVKLARQLDSALAEADFSVVGCASHTFSDPTAVTVARILAESHVVLHTWPEHGLITVDLFSCADNDKTEHFIERLVGSVGGVLVSRSDDEVPDSAPGR